MISDYPRLARSLAQSPPSSSDPYLRLAFYNPPPPPPPQSRRPRSITARSLSTGTAARSFYVQQVLQGPPRHTVCRNLIFFIFFSCWGLGFHLMIINLRFGGFFCSCWGLGFVYELIFGFFFLCSCVPVIRSVSFCNSHFLFRSNRIYCFLKFLWVGLLLL
jgi:hypothetical protein